MRVAIIGYGGRGMLYAEILKEKGVEISAVCDVNKAKLALAQKRLELADGALYAEEKPFSEKENWRTYSSYPRRINCIFAMR